MIMGGLYNLYLESTNQTGTNAKFNGERFAGLRDPGFLSMIMLTGLSHKASDGYKDCRLITSKPPQKAHELNLLIYRTWSLSLYSEAPSRPRAIYIIKKTNPPESDRIP